MLPTEKGASASQLHIASSIAAELHVTGGTHSTQCVQPSKTRSSISFSHRRFCAVFRTSRPIVTIE